MFLWIANDISFPMCRSSYCGSKVRSALDAVFGRNDCAMIAFAIFLIMMGYLPANSQIVSAPDHLFALAAWARLAPHAPAHRRADDANARLSARRLEYFPRKVQTGFPVRKCDK